MAATPSFDENLLQRPWTERLEFFRSKKVAHTKLIAVTQEIKRHIILRASEGFIFIVGPTRIGKTTVCASIHGSLLKDAIQEMQADPGLLPIAGMEASAYSARYNWRDHWYGSLDALNEPQIDHKIDYNSSRGPHIRPTEATAETRREATLRRSFENSARHRKLKVFSIDEAQHLTLVPSARMHRSQLEIIKSSASKSGAMHLLFGTYDLLKLRNASGQLGTRAVTVHFGRYLPIDSDLTSFAKVVDALVSFMPLPEPPDFTDTDLEYIFETSLGCVGLMKVWFIDVLGYALEADKKTLSISDLERHSPPIDVREKICEEIVAGEKLLEQDTGKLRSIRLKLAKSTNPAKSTNRSSTEINASPSPNDKGSSNQNGRKAKQGKRRPGERNPKRDAVGAGRKRSA